MISFWIDALLILYISRDVHTNANPFIDIINIINSNKLI